MAPNFLRKRLADAYSTTALLAGIAAFATVLWFVWMHAAFSAWPAPYPFTHNFHADVDSPALALELARNEGDINAVLQPEETGTSAAVRSLRLYELLNWVYIPLYSAYLALFALAYRIDGWLRAAVLASVAALALSDILKIILALRSLASSAAEVYQMTLVRWSLLALVMALLAVTLLRPSDGPYSIATRRLLGITHCAIALLLLLAVCFGQYRWLALGNRVFLLTAFVNAVGLAGPVFALNGVHLEIDPDYCKKRARVTESGSVRTGAFST